MNLLLELAPIQTSGELLESFRAGDLPQRWHDEYSGILFHDHELQTALNQRDMTSGTYHFVEWTAAIWLYERHGLRSLNQQYDKRNHPQKNAILERIAPPQVVTELFSRTLAPTPGTEAPDLFLYSEDESVWGFCDAKRVDMRGGGLRRRDQIGDRQRTYWSGLARLSGRPVFILPVVIGDEPMGDGEVARPWTMR